MQRVRPAMDRPAFARAFTLGLALVGLGAAGSMAGGCMKAGPPAATPIVVVAVSPVSAPALSVGGPASVPHPVSVADDHLPGDPVEVEWQGSWLPATLVERRGDRWLVRYQAGEDDDREDAEEVVERRRIRVPIEPVDGDEDADFEAP